MSVREKAIERALEIVNAEEWSGDMRVNMTTVIGAGRVLAKALLDAEEAARWFYDELWDRSAHDLLHRAEELWPWLKEEE